MQDQFATLKNDTNREAEFSRVARKAADNLQSEYCRIVHSVASEKQRNLMFIERAKRDFVSEMTGMNCKLSEIDNLKKGFEDLKRQN